MKIYDVSWKQMATVLDWHGFSFPADMHRPTKKNMVLLVKPLYEGGFGAPTIARLSKYDPFYRVEFFTAEEYNL